MISALRVSNIYKSVSKIKVQTIPHIDKYDSGSTNDADKKSARHFKDILQKEISKSDSKK